MSAYRESMLTYLQANEKLATELAATKQQLEAERAKVAEQLERIEDLELKVAAVKDLPCDCDLDSVAHESRRKTAEEIEKFVRNVCGQWRAADAIHAEFLKPEVAS